MFLEEALTKIIKETLREELKAYFKENPIIIKQIQVEPKFVSLDELVELRPIIGSKSTIYKKTSSGCMPYIKKGKKLIFNLEEIDKWLTQNNTNK